MSDVTFSHVLIALTIYYISTCSYAIGIGVKKHHFIHTHRLYYGLRLYIHDLLLVMYWEKNYKLRRSSTCRNAQSPSRRWGWFRSPRRIYRTIGGRSNPERIHLKRTTGNCFTDQSRNVGEHYSHLWEFRTLADVESICKTDRNHLIDRLPRWYFVKTMSLDVVRSTTTFPSRDHPLTRWCGKVSLVTDQHDHWWHSSSTSCMRYQKSATL